MPLTQEPKQTLIRAVARIQDLALKAQDANVGFGVFQGLMYSLTILFEETTGKKVENGYRPKDVMAWATKVRETGGLD